MRLALAYLAAALVGVWTGCGWGQMVDYNFSVTYSGQSMTGRVVGLNLDANGNGTNVDPAEVLIFSAPASVGLTASASKPYVFVPVTYEQYHEDFFTHIVTLQTTTTPGTYGFNVSNYTVSIAGMDLAMVDNNQVTLAFNSGGFVLTGGDGGDWGIDADIGEPWFVPRVDSAIGFAQVPEPATMGVLLAGGTGLVARRRRGLS